MQSHRRPRGKIFFEAFCAVCVGVSFVGAWTQTGAWAFLAPAFLFTLFGLYWALDMIGGEAQVRAVATPAPVPLADPEPVGGRESAVMPEIRFERFEASVEAAAEAAAVAELQPKKLKKVRTAKKAAEPVIRQVAAPTPVLEEQGLEEPSHEAHIEPLFDPQPFARQARPAFGKRPRGPGPRPLPA